jgi:hypothetical protein
VAVSTPKIDTRTAPDVVGQVIELLRVYTPELDPTRGISTALTGIFGRFAELIIERLNQVPQKNFLAFLDLLGASLMPPDPSSVPVTFSLAAGSAADGLVPAGTQVAAAPAEGEKSPVIFETERELVVTAAQLTSIFVRNPEQDMYADLSFIASSTSEYGTPIFIGKRNIDHILYIGHDALFSHPGLTELALTLDLSRVPDPDPFSVVWELWDGARWVTVAGPAPLPSNGSLKVSNVSTLLPREIFEIEKRWLRCRLLTPITPAADKRKGMVRASRLPVISQIRAQAKSSRTGMAIEGAFANATPLDVSKEFYPFGEKPRQGDALYLSVKEAFSEPGAAVTIRIMLANPAVADSDISRQQAGAIPPVKASENLKLLWEFWDGRNWTNLGTANSTTRTAVADFTDTTKAFTANGDDGKGGVVSFTFQKPPIISVVNGVENFWVRVRIASGNYGVEAKYELIDPRKPELGYKLIPATYAPPVISSIELDYTLVKSDQPEVVLAYNDFSYEVFTGKTFAPFQPTEDKRPGLYLGFSLPAGRASFPNRKISIYSVLNPLRHDEKFIPASPIRSKLSGASGSTVTHLFLITNPSLEPQTFIFEVIGARWDTTPNLQVMTLGLEDTGTEAKTKQLQVSVSVPEDEQAGSSDRGYLLMRLKSDPSAQYAVAFETWAGEQTPAGEPVQLDWGYSKQTGWGRLLVLDGSQSFTRPSLHEFLAPPDFSRRNEFGLTRYWLRIVWKSGQYLLDPVLHRLLVNTTIATQAVTIRNEILGSSDASKNQRFSATRSPILAGQQLEVREREMPPSSEQDKIREQEGDNAISVVRDETGRSKEIWVRWSQVPDFYGSDARDRHYVIDHLTGEIRFGDGLSGMIPSAGSGNIRLAQYRTGGGTAGNKPTGTITQFKTTVPYVEKVNNFVPAAGGAGAETLESLIERAPRTVRHSGRAVTIEDYEDLAILASPEVARARCVPLYNLAVDPGKTQMRPGTVSVIIVPRSVDAKPTPSLELINRVRDFISARHIPVVDLIVAGPQYVRVSIKTEIAPTSLEGESEIKLAIATALSTFLHPLTGGIDGRGWNFGRKPHKSDLYALIEAIAGVDHVHELKVEKFEESTGASETDRFLVYSGAHEITLRLEDS